MKEELLTGLVLNQFTTKALLDDYCQAMSKIENVSADVIRKRITDAAQSHLDAYKKSIEK